MPTALIWGYVLVSVSVAQPELEPWVAPDYQKQELCEADRLALLGTVPGRRAWCIPTMKPEKAKRTAKRRTAYRRVIRR